MARYSVASFQVPGQGSPAFRPRPLRRRPLRWFTLVIVGCLTFPLIHGAPPKTVQASWIQGWDAVSLADERAFLGPPKPPHRIVFYDNLRYPITAENALPVAAWAHPDFLPLIAVDANPWVGVSVLRATSAESSLADRLYANVQIQLILQEYERLQQQARQVLEGLGLNHLVPGVGTHLPPLAGPALTSAPMQAPPEEDSLEARLARLRAAYRQAAMDEAAAAPAEPGSVSPSFLAMMASPSTANASGSQASGSGKAAVSPTGTREASTGSGASGAEKSVPDYTPPSLGPLPMKARPVGEDEPLPWILRAALAVFEFVFRHKGAILGAIFFVVALSWTVAIVMTVSKKRP